MGVSIREKVKSSGIWWVFIRHAGERISEQVGSKEDAEGAKKEIESDIRRGRFNMAAVKAARQAAVKKEEKPQLPTLKEFFDRTMSPLWESTLAPVTFTRYETSFRVHILPSMGELPLDEFTRDQVKRFVVSLLQETAPKRTHGEERQAEEVERER